MAACGRWRDCGNCGRQPFKKVLNIAMPLAASLRHRWHSQHTPLPLHWHRLGSRMISHGTTRLVLCLGPYAIKIAKGERGRRCNRFEAATEERRKMLCPILATIPFGFALVMKRATPISEEEKDHLIVTDGFPDWDYVPP
jgi:hypothetical protein